MAFSAGGDGGRRPPELRSAYKRGLRIALTKNSVTFYRLPSGAYGLLEWYPNAKPQSPGEPPKRKRGRPRKSEQKRRGRPPKAKAAENVVDIGKEAAADSEPTAAAELRKSRAAERAKRGSEKPSERKEEPHVVHEPDVTGPVTGTKAA